MTNADLMLLAAMLYAPQVAVALLCLAAGAGVAYLLWRIVRRRSERKT